MRTVFRPASVGVSSRRSATTLGGSETLFDGLDARPDLVS
jgi:hypothetical protein